MNPKKRRFLNVPIVSFSWISPFLGISLPYAHIVPFAMCPTHAQTRTRRWWPFELDCTQCRYSSDSRCHGSTSEICDIWTFRLPWACTENDFPKTLGNIYKQTKLSHVSLVAVNKCKAQSNCIHDPTFRHSNLVSSSGVIWSHNAASYILEGWGHLPTRWRFSCGK